MKTKSLDSQQITKQLIDIGKSILRYHVIIAIVAVFSLLIFAVFTVNDILSSSTDQAYLQEQQAKSITTKFDTQTISKINELRSRQENQSLELPSGRINPFRE